MRESESLRGVMPAHEHDHQSNGPSTRSGWRRVQLAVVGIASVAAVVVLCLTSDSSSLISKASLLQSGNVIRWPAQTKGGTAIAWPTVAQTSGSSKLSGRESEGRLTSLEGIGRPGGPGAKEERDGAATISSEIKRIVHAEQPNKATEAIAKVGGRKAEELLTAQAMTESGKGGNEMLKEEASHDYDRDMSTALQAERMRSALQAVAKTGTPALREAIRRARSILKAGVDGDKMQVGDGQGKWAQFIKRGGAGAQQGLAGQVASVLLALRDGWC